MADGIPQKKPRKLPAWLNHFNGHDLKIFVRCWAAAWVALLLTFIHPSLTVIGQATYFSCLVLCIVPPASILFIYLLAAVSLLFGMCLAWAWGLLTMKAALAVRSSSETAVKIQALQKQAAAIAQQTGKPIKWEAGILVNKGFMLDARVTAVFYVLGCLFIYVLARVRCKNPKLQLMQIFGTIITDLFILYGPSLPRFNASIASLLVKPAAIGIGLGATCCLLFFPHSTSYVVLGSMTKLIGMMESTLDITRRRLNDEIMTIEQLKGIKAAMIGVYKSMEPAIGFLPLDFSRGRWNSDDVKSLQSNIRETMAASLSLLDVHMSWIKAKNKADALKMQGQVSEDDTGSEKNENGHVAGQREMKESAMLMEALRSPEHAAMQNVAFEALQRTTSEVLEVASQSLKLSARCILAVNNCRWIRKTSQQTFDELIRELQDTIATLRVAREKCVTSTTEGVLEAYADIFDEAGDLKSAYSLGPPSLRGIILTMVVEERILVATQAIERFLAQILRLMETRTSHRIWVPSRLQYALSWVLSAKASVPDTGAFDERQDDPDDAAKDPVTIQEESKEEAYRRLRVSRGYEWRCKRNGLSAAIVRTYEWLFNPAGMYGIRMVIVTVATAIPSAIPHSAGFFYREKGIWAVITAQTCMLVYMADFTFSLVSRLLGTILGGVLGMVTWYIGSGSGDGNPYGMAAITAVSLVIVLWLRIFLPPAYTKATILAGATFVLVVGFSYDHSHIVQYGLPGIGYVAFWKRLVTVLLGFVAATVIQIVPKTPSANNHVCRTLSNSLRTISDHYALLLSHWGQRKQRSPLGSVAEEISIRVSETLMELNEMVALLKWEITTSPFDQAILRRVQDHCLALNQSLRSLLALSSTLPPHLQDRLARTFGLLDDRMIGDVMAVMNIAEQALLTGSPLPERMPTPLVGRFYDSWHAQHRNAVLSKDLVRDEDYRRYCVAMSSYLKFLSTIDDLVLVLKGALGECHVVSQWEVA